MDASKNSHVKDQNVIREMVWYEGADPILEGEGVSYLIATGTATAKDGRRCSHVNRPTTSTNRAFAGVAARNYPAVAGGQFIEINCPGSKGVNIALGADTVLNTGILTFTAGSGTAGGRFVLGGFEGRGSARIRQTVTALIESSMVGAWSLATDGITLTVADTTGLAAGDTVVLLGGEDEGSDKKVRPGKYTIASVTSSTVLVLASSAVVATPDAAVTATGYAYTGNPTAQADLLTGDESGGVEFISPPNTGGATAVSYMSGGVSAICGGVTVGTADANGALPNGAHLGQHKRFLGLGTLTTNDAKATLATAGKQQAVNADTGVPLALASVAIDAANETSVLVWQGIWVEVATSGATLAAS